MRHYDVQLIGGMVLHRGRIAEMKTGEGKTLVATCPLYLNALAGKGAHSSRSTTTSPAATPSGWARSTASWACPSAPIVHGMSDTERSAYRCDITYGTNNEFGFDYLRDNMKESIERYVQRELHYAIVDEVDSILIDEARTPLIISRPGRGAADTCTSRSTRSSRAAPRLDYTVDEKAHSAVLTDAASTGSRSCSAVDNLYDPRTSSWLHHVSRRCGRTRSTSATSTTSSRGRRGVIIDEFTGRKMPGRRWSDGLHQAIEAKEGVEIQRRPDAGDDHVPELLPHVQEAGRHDRHGRHRGGGVPQDLQARRGGDPDQPPMVRKDVDDLVYKNERGKFKAVVAEIEAARARPAGAGRHVQRREVEVIHQLLEEGHPAQGAQRQAARARGDIVAQAGRKAR
jgi:preprotein translocase subunit SecA